jgi:hypothetical protein
MCWLDRWHMGPRFLHQTSVGILQYVPIRLGAAFVALITGYMGCYGNGEFKVGPRANQSFQSILHDSVQVNKAFLWITLVVNFSQMWAIYCLVLFYLGEQYQPCFAELVLLILFCQT